LTVSGTIGPLRIHDADSPLTQGQAGEVRGGDRLPWIGAGAQDNLGPLRSLDWQLNVYGTINRELAMACAEVGLRARTFAWSEAADNAEYHLTPHISRDRMALLRSHRQSRVLRR
jgi:hypothetical protein